MRPWGSNGLQGHGGEDIFQFGNQVESQNRIQFQASLLKDQAEYSSLGVTGTWEWLSACSERTSPKIGPWCGDFSQYLSLGTTQPRVTHHVSCPGVIFLLRHPAKVLTLFFLSALLAGWFFWDLSLGVMDQLFFVCVLVAHEDYVSGPCALFPSQSQEV